MSWLLGISRDDRLAAERIAGNSLIIAEIVSDMLGDIWERWFSEREQRELDSDEAAELFDNAGENRAKCVPAYNLKDEDAIEFIKKLKGEQHSRE